MNISLSKISLTFILGITVSVISGCFNSGGGIPYYALSDEFASYCWFEAGSSWVYQNDSTLATESIIIGEVDVSKRFNPQNVDYNYQAVEMYMKDNTLGITRHELTAGDYEVVSGEMNSLLRIYKSDDTYELIFSPKYPIGEEIALGDVIGLYSNVEIIESLELNGNTYNDVYLTRIIKTVGNNIEHNYWIAKNYSLIKTVSTINGQTTSISLISSSLTGR